MRAERARLTPLTREVAIHQIRAVAHHTPEPRREFLEERQFTLCAEMEERAPGELERVEELRDGVRAVAAAVRLLRWRRRRLERTLAAHRDTSL